MIPTRLESIAACARPALLGLVLLLGGCDGGDPKPHDGSETHFLRRCESDAACGEGFECLCGACTKACSEPAECGELAAGTAACVALQSRTEDLACSDTAVTAFCEVPCSVNADCAAIGPEHRCDRGYCRRLAADCRNSGAAGDDVVLLGDSFIARDHGLTAALERLARESGALAESGQYRDYSSSITALLGGDDPGIREQYAAARADGPVRVVIMNGGGADILVGSCEPASPSCPEIEAAVAGANALFQELAAGGVEQVVYFFYPDPQNARLMAAMDVLRPLAQASCESSPVPCHWLDLRPTFAGHYTEYILSDGINPTPAGSEAAAAAVWSLMQQRCIAQ